MSFYQCLVTVLKSAGFLFTDEKAMGVAFNNFFGASGESFGLDPKEDGNVPSILDQHAFAANMLDIRVKICPEVAFSSSNYGKSHEVTSEINPEGSRIAWARWKSAARNDIEAMPKFQFGEVAAYVTLTVSEETLNSFGWSTLLGKLVAFNGRLDEALLDLRSNLVVDKEASQEANRDDIPEIERNLAMIDAFLSKLQSISHTPKSALVAKGDADSLSSSIFTEVDEGKGNKSLPSTDTSIRESDLLMKLVQSNSTGVISSVALTLPKLSQSSRQAIKSYAKEYTQKVAGSSMNSSNKSVHPIRGLTAEVQTILRLIWNMSPSTKGQPQFDVSDSVEPQEWLKLIAEAVRTTEKSPKSSEKIELQRNSKGAAKIDEFIYDLHEYYDANPSLDLQKQIDVALKGMKKNFRSVGNFIEDTSLPLLRAEADFKIEKLLFCILSEFRQAARHANPQKSIESSDDSDSGSEVSRRRYKRDKKDSNRNRNKKADRSKARESSKVSADEKNSGKESGKKRRNSPTACWICGEEGHGMRDCPQFDPDYKKKNQPSDKKGRLAMIRSSQPSVKSKPLFCGTAQLSASASNAKSRQDEVSVFYDTGAEDYNYCSEVFALKAEASGYSRRAEGKKVELADGKTTIALTHSISVNVDLIFSECGRANKAVSINCFILSDLPYEITIGGKDIVKHDLLLDLAFLAGGRPLSTWSGVRPRIQVEPSSSKTTQLSSKPEDTSGLKSSSLAKASVTTEMASRGHPDPSQSSKILSSEPGSNTGREGEDTPTPEKRVQDVVQREEPPRVSVEKTEGGFVLVHPPGFDEDPFELKEVLTEKVSDKDVSQISWGTGIRNELARSLVALVERYNDIFSEEVSNTPCDLEPYSIRLDPAVKFPPKAMQSALRPQTAENLDFIKKKLAKWQSLGIIKQVSSNYWSQIHVVRAEGKNPRLCIDWKSLNAGAIFNDFPIPDIKKTSLPILKNHKFYAKVDLTDAYTQIAMHDDSIAHTAFRSLEAIWAMLRLGFGHHGAVAHFQKELVLKVLKGLVGDICHNYLDDISIWGDSEEEFLRNISLVFDRLRHYKIKAKASKLKFGTSITFLGHLINSMGMAMTDDRKEALARIQLPSTVRELHVFLGTANFFRDFVKDHSKYTVPLTKLLEKNLRAKLNWSADQKKSFEALKSAILKAPILWWLQAGLKTGVSTDASIYCWGSYLWQLDKDHKRRIILFMSGTFSGAALNWPIGEKEMFAIVATLEKIKYLIGSIHITIETDHRNLVFIDSPSKNAKIERWKLRIAAQSHTLKMVSGEADTHAPADGMTRLMRIAALGGIREVHVDLIRHFHGGASGHRGVEATTLKLKECGHRWEGMEEQIKAFISSCPICQVVKVGSYLKRGVSQTFEIAPTAELESVAMDTLGPLEEDKQGFKHILALTDEFSRHTDLTPLKTTTAAEAAQAIITYCCTYGIPKSFKSDRGSQFNNEVIKEVVKSLGCETVLTPVGSSEDNAIVERRFREVRKDLAGLVREDPGSSWSSKVKIVQSIMNSNRCSSTGVVPADLRFGRPQALDTNRLISAASLNSPSSLPRTALQEAQLSRLRTTYDKLAETISASLKRHQDANAKKRVPSPTVYSPGDWVFWELKSSLKGDPSATRRTGPYKVIRQEGNAVTISANEKEKIIPVAACTPFVHGQVAPEKLQAENSERAEKRYFVQAIIDHKFEGKGQRINNCKLLVHWTGYEPEWCLLSEVPDLRQTEALVQYVKEHKDLAFLVDKSLRP